VFGYAERDGAYFYNSAAVFDRAGHLVGTYRKTTSPPTFRASFAAARVPTRNSISPGTSLPVFEVEGVRFGIQICNDRLYPEPSRKLALKGAEIIFMPIAYATYGNDNYRVAIWDSAAAGAASTTACSWSPPTGSATRTAGATSAMSAIVNPLGGRIMKQATWKRRSCCCGDRSRRHRQGRRSLPWWRDRRPDLYGNLDPV
jgi:N-carbamoylputrescine amidase